MRWSQIFGRTLRQAPAGGGPSVALAQRAALVRLVDDTCVMLTLGHRLLNRIEASLRQRLPPAAEVRLPSGADLGDWVALLAAEIQSYRQLPAVLSCRRARPGDVRPPLGLASPGEMTVLEQVWAIPSADLRVPEQEWATALRLWAEAAGLDLRPAEGPDGQGWAWLDEQGPVGFVRCDGCGSMAAEQVARVGEWPQIGEPSREQDLVETPGADTIRALVEMLQVPASRTLKALFLSTLEGEVVLAALPGDREVSLTKLGRAIGARQLRPAEAGQIRSVGAEPGFASPLGLNVRPGLQGRGVLVVGDPSIAATPNLVAGANRSGYHMCGVNYPRDFAVSLLADICLAQAGDTCPACGHPLSPARGIWLASWQAQADAFRFTGEGGEARAGSLGIGSAFLEPMMAALLGSHAGEPGIAWPAHLAPIDVYVVVLADWAGLDSWVERLEQAGHGVLVDDRPLSAGVKFGDAELVGAPLRVTVSARSLAAGGLEFSSAAGAGREVIPLHQSTAAVFARLRPIM
jgi:prolyl-tRNA synthetase